jgi:hypothetical protein
MGRFLHIVTAACSLAAAIGCVDHRRGAAVASNERDSDAGSQDAGSTGHLPDGAAVVSDSAGPSALDAGDELDVDSGEELDDAADAASTGPDSGVSGSAEAGIAAGTPLLARLIAVGDETACAVRSEASGHPGKLACWGRALSATDTTRSERARSVEGVTLSRQNSDPSNPTVLKLGTHHACAADVGKVWCWGSNADGQIDPSAPRADIPLPVQTFKDRRAEDIAPGAKHTCALSFRTVRCWGAIAYGFGNALSVDTSLTQVCARQVGGGVGCWDATPRNSPRILSVGSAAQLDMGFHGGCIREPAPAGTATCWEGNGTTGNASPSTVAGLMRATDVSAGNDFACAVADPAVTDPVGSVRCWGRGYGDSPAVVVLPQASQGSPPQPVTARRVSVGSHACVLRSDEHVFCWLPGQTPREILNE